MKNLKLIILSLLIITNLYAVENKNTFSDYLRSFSADVFEDENSELYIINFDGLSEEEGERLHHNMFWGNTEFGYQMSKVGFSSDDQGIIMDIEGGLTIKKNYSNTIMTIWYKGEESKIIKLTKMTADRADNYLAQLTFSPLPKIYKPEYLVKLPEDNMGKTPVLFIDAPKYDNSFDNFRARWISKVEEEMNYILLETPITEIQPFSHGASIKITIPSGMLHCQNDFRNPKCTFTYNDGTETEPLKRINNNKIEDYLKNIYNIILPIPEALKLPSL